MKFERLFLSAGMEPICDNPDQAIDFSVGRDFAELGVVPVPGKGVSRRSINDNVSKACLLRI